MFLIQKRTIFVALLCWSRNKMMQVEERHYYYYWRECECVCGWMSGLVPWLHLLHPMQHTRWEQMCTKIEKPLKGRFYYELHRRHLQKPEQKKKSGFRRYWEFVSCLHAIFWPHTQNSGDQDTWGHPCSCRHRLCNVIHFSVQFTSPCWHLWTRAICERVRTCSHSIQRLTKICLFLIFLNVSSAVAPEAHKGECCPALRVI